MFKKEASEKEAEHKRIDQILLRAAYMLIAELAAELVMQSKQRNSLLIEKTIDWMGRYKAKHSISGQSYGQIMKTLEEQNEKGKKANHGGAPKTYLRD